MSDDKMVALVKSVEQANAVDRVAAALHKVPYLPVAEAMRERAREAGANPPTANEIYAEWCRQKAVAAIGAM